MFPLSWPEPVNIFVDVGVIFITPVSGVRQPFQSVLVGFRVAPLLLLVVAHEPILVRGDMRTKVRFNIVPCLNVGVTLGAVLVDEYGGMECAEFVLALVVEFFNELDNCETGGGGASEYVLHGEFLSAVGFALCVPR